MMEAVFPSRMEYNFNTWNSKSKEGIVMLGKWGNITAERFSFNSYKDIYRFEGKSCYGC